MKVSFSSLTHLILALVSFISSTSFPAFACSWDYPIWQIRDKTADPYYRFFRNRKAGYIDRNGKVVVQPTLSLSGNYGDEFHDGLLLTGVAYGPYVDASGKVVLDTKSHRNWAFSDGLAAAMRDDGGRWGFIDKTGKFVIEPKFASYPRGYVDSFSEGLAMVKVNEKYGFIDRTGEFVIRPNFIYAQSFQENTARIILEGPCIRVGGEEPCDFGETLGKATEQEKVPVCKWIFIDKTGTQIAKAEFDNAKDFSEGLAAVQISGKWGFIDKTGKIVVRAVFDKVSSFSDGLAKVGDGWPSNLKWGFIDKTGKIVIPIQFDIAEDFGDGLAPVGKYDKAKYRDGNYYYIDKAGKRAFKGTFEQASHYFKGIAHVKLQRSRRETGPYQEGRYAYIDTKGRVIFTYDRG